MGREVRRVPAHWEHPKDAKGWDIPLFDGFFEKARAWDEGKTKWEEGFRKNYLDGSWVPKDQNAHQCSWEDWSGRRPNPAYYMPDFPAEQRTHFQMYENTTEGTPISPVCATPEELAHWLADNDASASGHLTATYEQWLYTIQQGYAPALSISAEGVVSSGVAGIHDQDS